MFEFRVKLAGVPMLIRCRFDENRFFFRDYLCEEEPRFIIQPTDADLGAIKPNPDNPPDENADNKPEYISENLALHSLIAEKLVAENVLLMHGSAVCFDGEAVVFTAKSGTGKSTHARLWRKVFGDRITMINDDKPLLKIEEDGVTVCGTPWNGKHHLSKNISAPLRAIVKLERSPVNLIEPTSRADAFPTLAEQSYSSKDPATAIRIIALEKRVLNAAGFYVLKCNMDPDAARVARDGIFGPDKNTVTE